MKQISYTIVSVAVCILTGYLLVNFVQEIMPVLVFIIIGITIAIGFLLNVYIPLIGSAKTNKRLLRSKKYSDKPSSRNLESLARSNEIDANDFEEDLKQIFFSEDEFDYKNSILRLILEKGHYNVAYKGIVTSLDLFDNDNVPERAIQMNQLSILHSKHAIVFVDDSKYLFVISSDILLWASSFVEIPDYLTEVKYLD